MCFLIGVLKLPESLCRVLETEGCSQPAACTRIALTQEGKATHLADFRFSLSLSLSDPAISHLLSRIVEPSEADGEGGQEAGDGRNHAPPLCK